MAYESIQWSRRQGDHKRSNSWPHDSWKCYLAAIANYYLLWGSTIGYPSNSLASCSNEDLTFVGRGRHGAFFTNLCCALIDLRCKRFLMTWTKDLESAHAHSTVTCCTEFKCISWREDSHCCGRRPQTEFNEETWKCSKNSPRLTESYVLYTALVYHGWTSTVAALITAAGNLWLQQ